MSSLIFFINVDIDAKTHVGPTHEQPWWTLVGHHVESFRIDIGAFSF